MDAIGPYSEADPAAHLVHVLAFAGCAMGPGPFVRVGSTRHWPRLFALAVGRTSRARKGTAGDDVGLFVEFAAPEFWGTRRQSGLSSGEGLISAVEDKPGEAPTDRRLLVVETEFSRCLRVMTRPGNTVSAVLRDAWDRDRLRTMTKVPLAATGAHIAIVGHITLDELRRELTDTEAANGFGNRFLFVLAQRARLLPDCPPIPESVVVELGGRLGDAITAAQSRGEVRRDAGAQALWRDMYPSLTADVPGLVGALTARAEVQVIRLALVYALLDGASAISGRHMAAAATVWRYCETSVRHVFGDASGDAVGDAIVAALRERAPDGLTRTDIRDLFGRNETAGRTNAALRVLEERDMVTKRTVPTGGRFREEWHLHA